MLTRLIVSCAGGLEIKSQAGHAQRCKRLATASTPTQELCCLGAMLPRWALKNSLHALTKYE